MATPPPPSLAKGRTTDKLCHYAQAHLNGKALDILCVRCAATATRDLQDWSALEATLVLGPEACWPGLPDIVHPEVTQAPNTEIALPLVQRLDIGCRMGLWLSKRNQTMPLSLATMISLPTVQLFN